MKFSCLPARVCWVENWPIFDLIAGVRLPDIIELSLCSPVNCCTAPRDSSGVTAPPVAPHRARRRPSATAFTSPSRLRFQIVHRLQPHSRAESSIGLPFVMACRPSFARRSAKRSESGHLRRESLQGSDAIFGRWMGREQIVHARPRQRIDDEQMCCCWVPLG